MGKTKGWAAFKQALGNRTLLNMLIFGFCSGLPFTLLIGTLTAWLSDAKINVATIGVLSLIGMAYAFKFLWSPLVDQVRLPLLERLGRRKSWIILCQVLLVSAFILIVLTNPAQNTERFALFAMMATLASATQDIAMDAWRIEAASETAPLEVMTALYQLGYRVSALAGGAGGLLLASAFSWPLVYVLMAGLLALGILNTLSAKDTPRPSTVERHGALKQVGEVSFGVRLAGLVFVGLCWGWAIYEIGVFMVQFLAPAKAGVKVMSATEFTKGFGPWIVFATIIIPTLIAALMNWAKAARWHVLDVEDTVRRPASGIVDHIYTALVLPMCDLVYRLRWGILIAMGWILTYQLCTNMWATFANPLYFKHLHYSKVEIAFASKTFGVVMTIFGIGLGGYLLMRIGAFITQLLGIVCQIFGTFVYADLADGSPTIDLFTRTLGLNNLAVSLHSDARMVHLMTAISIENISMGVVSTAFTAFVSRITSKSFSAVQYALLSSLTFLVGSLGRGAVGESIDHIGYGATFRGIALIGFVGLGFVLLEGLRGRLWGAQRAKG